MLWSPNVDIIKTEDDVDVLGEEDSTGMIPDEFYVPSAFSTVKTEPKSPLNEHQLMHGEDHSYSFDNYNKALSQNTV
ncbi:hypothetical protein L798_06327 [Zootermopsis nevadensis]|uniref:Uncharacterized protein n=1 Tax=Zootermopsis nevadensis TaxID=136037 RepID=A0A067R6Q3_ZOONE|nr:hypothetical protein L798_06327 [Zootermopsis nevadensis]